MFEIVVVISRPREFSSPFPDDLCSVAVLEFAS